MKLPRTLMIAALLPASAAFAADIPSCKAYQMDVDAEVELFQSEAISVKASADAAAASEVRVGQLFEVRLASQKETRFTVLPRREIDPAQYGGMLRVHIAEGGRYRVSVDAPSWVDAVFDGKSLETLDFRSNRECAGPTKIVTFNVPAGADLLLQVIDVDRPSVRLTVTPVPLAVW